jgi:LPPG:FO 2-phospho-L-lactate transferase
VSPIVAGAVVKGPTAAFMHALGRPATAAGAASLYEGLLSGLIADERDPDPPPVEPQTLAIPTLMNTIEDRVRVAQATIDFAAALRGA